MTFRPLSSFRWFLETHRLSLYTSFMYWYLNIVRQSRRSGGRNELHRSGRLAAELSVPEHEARPV
jgi:hypothetical protein